MLGGARIPGRIPLSPLDSALIKSGVDAGIVRAHQGPSVISVSERRSLFAAFEVNLRGHTTFFKNLSAPGKKETGEEFLLVFKTLKVQCL